jgi:PPOX class probable F420-dependent enzyme
MPDERQLLELIATSHQGVLAAVTRAGYPHLTNVLYVWDSANRIARVSTTADRVKGRILRRDPRAALHVAGSHFWSYAVAECDAELSEVATMPGDAVCQELLGMAKAIRGEVDEEAAFKRMIEERRLVVRLRVRRLYGVLLDKPPGR